MGMGASHEDVDISGYIIMKLGCGTSNREYKKLERNGTK